MAEKKTDNYQARIARDLDRLKDYERLLDRQEELAENGELESLIQVLDEKSKILAEVRTIIDEPHPELGLAAGSDRKKDGAGGELLKRFRRKVAELEAREQTSLEKAMLGKIELEEQLQTIHHGKKLFRGYGPGMKKEKAKFKDITM
ncbi:MAG: hypothetical protein U9P14_05725 [Gemmatimonadota bacterium]|nr:hypothetical protein [Gemmatimonadota bacterium]